MGRKKNENDTIAAISTPLGEGGIGIIRLSGPKSWTIAKRIFAQRPGKNKDIRANQVYYGWVVDPKTRQNVDEALFSFFKAPNSYTGEDVVEISCHGCAVILQTVLQLSLHQGARLAQRGEFTKRAFFNGRLDLAQAEAVIDLIQAPTRESAFLAVRQLEGDLSKQIRNLRQTLLGVLSEMEASLDFPEDIEDPSLAGIQEKVASCQARVAEMIATADLGRVLREGLTTVIIGRPNVGKSSLLNALLKEERAIVTDMPGTTRDLLEERLNIQGLWLKLIDTAGLRNPRDKAEEAGVERAKEKLALAELVLLVLEAPEGVLPADQDLLRAIAGKKAIIVINKIDLGEHPSFADINFEAPTVRVSALLGQGIKDLEKAVVNLVASQKILALNQPIITRLRHKEQLAVCQEALSRVAETLSAGKPLDLATIDLKDAVVALGEVTGEEVSEEVINKIFEEFCIGK